MLQSRVGRRRALVAAAVAVLVAGLAVAVAADPFGGGAPVANAENAASTSLATVTRRDLSQQTSVSATLGYADATSVSVPAGTAPSAVSQAQQAAVTARSSVDVANATLAADLRALESARATLAADRSRQAVDCRGDNAAQSAAASAGSAGACASVTQAAATDEQAVATAAAKVDADRRGLGSARASLAAAEESLFAAASSAASYEQSAVYTELPSLGDVVRRGGTLYAVGGQPTVLLYGAAPAWRAFSAGMSLGRDVAELNANLRALGDGAPEGDAFTSATAAAIRAFQSAHGLVPTGQLLLGSVVFEPGAVRVTAVTPTRGAAVQPGAVLSVTSVRRVVTIQLDASQQTSVKVGDPVTITLPDDSTTPGHVSYVGTVATTPSGSGNQSQTPTIEVDVTPDRPSATGRLDQAPVDVSITTATVRGVLAVPVNALLALAGGGYAVEVVDGSGAHRLVAVTPGLFDDAEGLVQVERSGLAAGQRVVVPSS